VKKFEGERGGLTPLDAIRSAIVRYGVVRVEV
jgi:hypothetical protein